MIAACAMLESASCSPSPAGREPSLRAELRAAHRHGHGRGGARPQRAHPARLPGDARGARGAARARARPAGPARRRRRAGADRARDARHRRPQPLGDDRARRRRRLHGRADPERAASAMEQVSSTGRHALGEMRRLLGVLREDDVDGAGAPARPGGPRAAARAGPRRRPAGRPGDLRRARRARRGRAS